MSLLTDSSIIGISEGGTKVASWMADGTLIGSITLPTAVNGKFGSVAASATDGRIYVTTVTSPVSANHLVRVYDADGVLLTTITPNAPIRSIYVPEAGKLWVAIHNSINGKVIEYDSDGVFQGLIADLTYTGGGYIEAGWGMYRFGGFLYYLALRGAGFEVNSGVFKDNLSDTAVSTQVRPMAPDTAGEQPRRMDMEPSGDFFVTDKNAGHIREVNRISSAGVFEQSYLVVPGGDLAGIALDQDGAFFWVGDVTNALIYRVKVSDGSKTSFDATVSGQICTSALCTPFGSEPAEDLPLSAACPTTTTGTLGESYNSQVNAVGGNPPYTYVVTSGALPPGLTLDADTGIITGTPTTAGEFDFTITITDTP